MDRQTSVPTILGLTLREQREKVGISQVKIAKHLSMTSAGWGKLESGVNSISIENLVSACELLDVKPSELLAIVEEKVGELEREGWSVSPKRIERDALAAGWGISKSTALSSLYPWAVGLAMAGPIGGLIGTAIAGYYLASKLKVDPTEQEKGEE